MDKNSIIGLVLIGVLIIAYSIYTQPNEAEIKAMKHKRDSVLAVEQAKQKAEEETKEKALAIDTSHVAQNDSAKAAMAEQQLGAFASAGTGEEKTYRLENDLMIVTVSSKGGRIKSAE